MCTYVGAVGPDGYTKCGLPPGPHGVKFNLLSLTVNLMGHF